MTPVYSSDIERARFFVENLLSYILVHPNFEWLPPTIPSDDQTLLLEHSQYAFLPHLGQLLICLKQVSQERLSQDIHNVFISVMSLPVSQRNPFLIYIILNEIPIDFSGDEWAWNFVSCMTLLLHLAAYLFLTGRDTLCSSTLYAMAVIIVTRIPGGFSGGLAGIRNFLLNRLGIPDLQNIEN